MLSVALPAISSLMTKYKNFFVFFFREHILFNDSLNKMIQHVVGSVTGNFFPHTKKFRHL